MPQVFWKNVGAVLSGTAVAQLIPILSSLVLARLFVPAAYGGYAVWLGIVLVVAVMVTLRLEVSLAVVKDGEERDQAFALVLVTILFMGIIAACIIVPMWWLAVLPAQINSPFLLFSALATALLVAAGDTWQSLAAADGNYRALVGLRIAQALLIAGGQFAAAAWTRDVEALVVGHMVGMLLSLVIACRLLPVGLRISGGLVPKVRRFWRSYSRFPLFALPADTISTLSAQLPLLLVASRFGSDKAGILAMTFRVLGAPLSLLGRAVLDVFRRHAAEAFRSKGNCHQEYLSVLKVLSAGSLAFVIGTYVAGEWFFAFAFGEAWRFAGTLAIWLAPLFALRFVASPLSYTFYIVGKQNIDLVWQIALLGVVTMALMVPIDFRSTILAYGYGYSAMYLVYLGLSYECSKGRKR